MLRNYICAECGQNFVAMVEVDKCQDCSTTVEVKEDTQKKEAPKNAKSPAK